MKNKSVCVAFIILIISIIFSYLKISYYTQKNTNNNKKIIRYGNNIEKGDIIYIDSNKELVIEVLKDGSYITKIIK